MDNSRITSVLEHWFIEDPMLFHAVLAIPQVTANSDMSCALRCGQGRLEYNPDLIDCMSDERLASALKVEAVRILLRHPFERKPSGCCNTATAIGSNLVVSDRYDDCIDGLESVSDYELPDGQPYEYYSHRIQEMLSDMGVSDGHNGNTSEKDEESDSAGVDASCKSDISALWGEDEMMCQKIAQIIDKCREWGSLSGRFAEYLKASSKPQINWHNILNGFKGSIVSATRDLTRMRPNRRYGYDQMGTRRSYNNSVLVAVDTSGSITSKALGYFYGVINSAFRFGFEVHVVQFDTELKGKPELLRKAKREVVAVGRGGTCFQQVFDFMKDNGRSYDGLIILTDGYAESPKIPIHRSYRILWVCDDEKSYNDNSRWMAKSGRVMKLNLK